MSEKQFDQNMIVSPNIQRDGIKFYNADDPGFKMYGVWRDGDRYFRIRQSAADLVSPGISASADTTAGGRVRFSTDSPYVALHVALDKLYQYTGMAYTATCGLDVYDGNEFVGTVRPNVDTKSEIVEGIFYFENHGTHNVTVNLPLYCAVRDIFIGLDGGSSVTEPAPYKHEKPVVFYGSSITNGACASRPGLTYEAMIARELDFNHHNLGFGGLAKGEMAMADYIAGLEMSAFVMDYDHNAPNTEHLLATHEPFFKRIRESHPDIPILFISGPRLKSGADREARKDAIRRTYDNAVAAGDKNVYILYGDSFFDEIGWNFTVEGTHPNDLGFWFMAKGIAPVIKTMLEG